MTASVAGALVALGLLDGAFSGFRSSLGRTGLVDHTESDRAGLRRGLALVTLLSAPALLVLGVDVALLGEQASAYTDAGLTFLVVLTPYAASVLLALCAYGALGWKQRYLASALILGPFTLVRPYVVVAASLVGVLGAADVSVGVAAALAVAGVLLVEPVANRSFRH